MHPFTRRAFVWAGLGFACSLCGCNGGNTNSTTTSSGGPKPAAGGEIVIGHYASMTGDQATFGTMTDNGIKMAVDEINAEGGIGGKTIRLITYDERADAKEVAAAVQRLITRDGVRAVLGEVASSMSQAGAPVCQENEVPMITPSSTNPKVTQVGDMIFRVCFIDPFQGKVCAKFARENEKIKASKVAILYDQTALYSTGLRAEFKKAFEDLGGSISVEQTYSAGDQDFSAQLTAIRGSKPDAVFIPGYYTDVGNIAKQARKLNIKVPMLGGDGWESPELSKIGGDAIEGCFYSNHYSIQDPSPRIQNFVKKFKEKYDQEPDSLAALGYDAARVLFAAMKKDPDATGAKLAQAIAATKDFEGVTGNITLDEERNAVKAAVILEMVKGKPTYVATVEPEK